MATLKDLLVSGPTRVIGNITGKSFIKEGGTSSQFLKADGSVDSNTYSTSGHTHATSIATSTGTSQITLAHGTKYQISAGGSTYVFTTPSLPNATSSVAGIAKLGATGGSATFEHGHGTIKNNGSVATNTAIQSGDRLLITDTSDSNKIKGTSITFGSSKTTYLRNDGTWGTPSGGGGGGATQLPVTMFEDDVNFIGTKGSVIPIAKTSDDVNVLGSYSNIIKTVPTLIFPKIIEGELFALPIYMDGSGHLFTLLSSDFANFLSDYGFTAVAEY